MALTLFNSSLFRVDVDKNETILGGKVLSVKVGKLAVRDLSQPVRISFTHANETGGRCVYYEVLDDANGTGRWSTEGCVVSRTNTTFVCSCSHLSFFAVLVNTEVSIDPANALTLSYISYIGCGLSVFFTALTILMHLCLRKGRTDHSMAVHLNLTGALFFLHLFFLVSALWAGPGLGLGADWGGVACQALGLLLHYALLATFTWMAIESFHLYMLLVRVFNIYVAKYLLKLGLVGWGEFSILHLHLEIPAHPGSDGLGCSHGNSHCLCPQSDLRQVQPTDGEEQRSQHRHRSRSESRHVLDKEKGRELHHSYRLPGPGLPLRRGHAGRDGGQAPEDEDEERGLSGAQEEAVEGLPDPPRDGLHFGDPLGACFRHLWPSVSSRPLPLHHTQWTPRCLHVPLVPGQHLAAMQGQQL
ncbi:adhesion G-protein coupled receptor G5-like isoform X3 [Anguilla rostrata]